MKEDFFLKIPNAGKKSFLKNVVLAIHLQQFFKFYWCLLSLILITKWNPPKICKIRLNVCPFSLGSPSVMLSIKKDLLFFNDKKNNNG